MNSPIVGIDLGTTNSLLGVVEAGIPALFALEEGRRLLPSAVFLPEDPEENPIVGGAALRRRTLAPKRVITEAKRLIGRRFHEVDPSEFVYEVVSDEDGMAAIRISSRIWKPEEISALLLRAMKKTAEQLLETSVEKAVITVPAYFHDAQRAATKRAGELAGLQVERILSEPTAAALAHGFQHLKDHSKIAVFDLGGGTFDLSILQLSDGVFEVQATHGDTRLGGSDIDRILLGHLLDRAGIQLSALDFSERIRLLEACEAAKIRLSSCEETEILLPFFSGSESKRLILLRTELEALAAPVLRKIPALCRRALQDARVEAGELDRILLVGGATRMPAVRSLASEIFGKEPDTSQHPDEAIALGATIQAGVIEGSMQHMTLLDVIPLSLGIETYGGLMNVLLPRNTSIPCKAGEMFTNAVDGQERMTIRVLQGEREVAKDNWLLGEFEIPFTPAPRGQARVGVQFEIDADGILKVLVRDTSTGTDHLREIQSVVRISEPAVEEMLNQSLENAFEDMEERIFQETKLKAEELLAALEMAMGQLSNDLAPDEKATIDQLEEETRRWIVARDTKRLKESVERLDEMTEPLATRLLEKLMETDAKA